MTATVHYLHSQPEPIGQFVRIGNSGHRHLETLHCADRLRVEHVVVDAHGLTFRSIRSKRCARLGCGLFSIPTWRNSAHSVGTKVPDSAYRGPTPHVRYHLRISSRRVTGGLLRRLLASPLSARCTPFWHLAISSRASSTVGSKLDVMLCEALDAEGGEHIVIDYPLITTYSALRDLAQRRAFVAHLRELPFDNLWLRISGFGADASPAGVRRYISALSDFHGLARPIVADCVGGLAGLAIASFGASTAIAHGVAEKERFAPGTDHVKGAAAAKPAVSTSLASTG